MIRFEWTEELSVGNEKIDNQHKDLIDKVNALLMACREGVGLGELPETLEFLESHVVNHFRDEEELQRSIGFPNYQAHKYEHEKFIKTFGALKSEMNKQGPSLSLAIRTSGTVIAWLKEHFQNSDRELGRFIAGKSRPGTE